MAGPRNGNAMARREMAMLSFTVAWGVACVTLMILVYEARRTGNPNTGLLQDVKDVTMQAGVLVTMLFSFLLIASRRLKAWALALAAAWAVLTVNYYLFRRTELMAWIQSGAYFVTLFTMAAVLLRDALAQRRALRGNGQPAEES